MGAAAGRFSAGFSNTTVSWSPAADVVSAPARLGVTARAWIKPTDYGFIPLFADPIEIVVDTEFERAP